MIYFLGKSRPCGELYPPLHSSSFHNECFSNRVQIVQGDVIQFLWNILVELTSTCQIDIYLRDQMRENGSRYAFRG